MILLVLVALPVMAQEPEVVEGISRAEQFRRQDPTGGLMAATAICVVLSALAMLFLIFKGIGILVRKLTAPKPVKVVEEETVVAAAPVTDVGGDVFAAIAVAIFQYSRDLHDVENTVLTINRGAKAYSPWSSKIYGLRQIPDKR